LRFGTGFVGATGFAVVFDTGFVGTTRFVFPFGAAFLGTGRFVFIARFTARFAGATDFVFRFDFAPLAGFARATGLPFVFVAFVARVFGRDAETDFGRTNKLPRGFVCFCKSIAPGTGYDTSVERASIAAVSSLIVISPST
jgi:hypothetical protein